MTTLEAALRVERIVTGRALIVNFDTAPDSLPLTIPALHAFRDSLSGHVPDRVWMRREQYRRWAEFRSTHYRWNGSVDTSFLGVPVEIINSSDEDT